MVVVVENVPQWQTVGKENFDRYCNRVAAIKDEDGKAYYNLYHKKINSSDHGCPQNRVRLYVVALAAFADEGFSWPERSDMAELSSILDEGSVFYRSCSVADVPDDILQTKTATDSLAMALVQIEDEQPLSHQYVVDIGAGRGNRLSKAHFPTLTASRCKSLAYWSPNMRRRFTLKELARGQGAQADGMNMKGIKKTRMGHIIGNAMSVAVVCEVLKQALVAVCSSLE